MSLSKLLKSYMVMLNPRFFSSYKLYTVRLWYTPCIKFYRNDMLKWCITFIQLHYLLLCFMKSSKDGINHKYKPVTN